MNTLWSPWRIEHVLGNTHLSDSCLFCPPDSCSFSKELLLLFKNDKAVCLLNRFPYTNGHILAAPARHVSCLTELNTEEMTLLMDLVSKATSILRNHLKPDGFNIGMNIGSDAGAGIAEHLHVHIVPRWNGDHNFMTVLADVRTIPEHIEKTFDKLLPDFQLLKQQRTK